MLGLKNYAEFKQGWYIVLSHLRRNGKAGQTLPFFPWRQLIFFHMLIQDSWLECLLSGSPHRNCILALSPPCQFNGYAIPLKWNALFPCLAFKSSEACYFLFFYDWRNQLVCHTFCCNWIWIGTQPSLPDSLYLPESLFKELIKEL